MSVPHMSGALGPTTCCECLDTHGVCLYRDTEHAHRPAKQPSPHRTHYHTTHNLPHSKNNLLRQWSQGRVVPDTFIPSDHEILTHADLAPARAPHGLTADQALRLVLDSFRSLPSKPPKRARPKDLIVDLPWQIFNDIDATLFRSVLRGNVYLVFTAALPNGLDGRTIVPEEGGRIKLELHERLRQEESGLVVRVLVHQMIHAFLLQCCGFPLVEASKQADESSDESIEPRKKHHSREDLGSPLSHGPLFAALASLVFIDCLGQSHPVPMHLGTRKENMHIEVQNRVLRKEMQAALAPAVKGKTRCLMPWHPSRKAAGRESRLMTRADENEVPELDLGEGVTEEDGAARPIAQFFHLYSSSESTYTPVLRPSYLSIHPLALSLHFDHRAVPIPRDQLGALPSIRDRETLELDDAPSFRILHAFLSCGAYGSPLSSRTRGPPTIGSYAVRGYDVLSDGPSRDGTLVDVLAARLGSFFCIPELFHIAMARLYRREACADPPLLVLEALYFGATTAILLYFQDKTEQEMQDSQVAPPPSTELRNWARRWLLRQRRNGWTNYEVLVRGVDGLEGLRALMERGGVLVRDVEAIRAELGALQQ